MVEVLVPLGAFGSFVLVIGQLTRLFSDIVLNRTLREALRSDPGSVPLLAERLGARQPWADELIGWIFIAFAAGLVLMALFETVDQRRDMFQGAIVPLVIGVVVIAFVRWAKPDGGDQGRRFAQRPSPAARTTPRAGKSSARTKSKG